MLFSFQDGMAWQLVQAKVIKIDVEFESKIKITKYFDEQNTQAVQFDVTDLRNILTVFG